MPRLRVGSSLPLALVAAILSGVLLWLSLPPADLGPLGFVALVPLLWALRGSRAKRGAQLGLAFGLSFYGPLLSWLIPVSVLGWSALVLGVAAFLAIFGALVAVLWHDRAPLRTALAVGAAWAGVEWLRSIWPFGGWSWVSLGSTQHDNPFLLPLAGVVGALGLGFLLASVNALLLLALLRVPRRAAMVPAGVALAIVALPALVPAPRAEGPPIDVAAVQGNVPLEIGTASRIIEDHLVAENHARLHRSLAGDPPDLVIWPENALDRDPARDTVLGPLVQDAVRETAVPALIGTIVDELDGRLLNQSVLYTPGAEVAGRYTKNHLLPFGEFVPFRDALEWIPDIQRVRTDLSPGTGPGRFELGDLRFAAIICFENAFPDLVRDFVRPDDQFLVVSTNNSTFGVSAAPEQHVVLSEMRAVESGRWVMHAALSGTSAVISPAGEVVDRTPLYEPAVLRHRIAAASGSTIYDRIGGWLPLTFLVLLGVVYLAPRRSAPRAVPPLGDDARIAVVIPTFNERATIEQVIERVLATSDRVDVKVVDDSSPDGTADVVRTVAERDPRVTLIERPEKGGLASAYLDGFSLSMNEGYDLVVEMDADLSHRPEQLPRLLEAARDHHVVLGSRYIPGGDVQNWSLLRRALSRGGNIYVRLLLGIPVADATSGYRVYRRGALRELVTHQLRSEGYGFQIELAYRAWRRGLSVGEVPITFEERRHGHSKISRGIVVEALWQVFLWALRDRLFRRPPRSAETA